MSCSKNEEYISINSPSENIEVGVSIRNGQLFYAINFDGKPVITPSQLGIIFKEGPSLSDDFEFIDVSFHEVDESWEQPWGEEKKITTKYREGTITLQSGGSSSQRLNLIFRVFDDGVAFRYHVEELGQYKQVVIADEITAFQIVSDATSWWIKAYHPNRYEQLYTSTPISSIDTVHTPLTMRLDDGTHLSIHEAVLENYSSMQLAGNHSTNLQCDLASWANGDKVRTSIPFFTPWRTIKIVNSASELVASNLTLNCNPPNKLGDVSWIKPSKYIGIWWGMIIGKWTWKEGLRHGATTKRGKEYVDFAAKHGFDEVLIEGTSAGFESLFPGDTVTTNFTETTADFNLSEVQKYAKSKGVSLQGYHETSASTLNYLAQIDDAFELIENLGIQKVKIGHVGSMLDKTEFHYGQYGINYYRKVLEKAAAHHIGVNFHEPIKDTGERRTYPNMLTREGAKGMEYNAWGNGGNPVNHTTILPFTRLLESPMDFTPGIFDLLYQNLDTDLSDQISVKITLTDKGNGYSNVRYKSSESYWQSKPMTLEQQIVEEDTTYIWSITEKMKPGHWEWGISAHDVATDNNNIWLLDLLKQKNNSIQITSEGLITGDVDLTIPFQGVNTRTKYTASEEDLNFIDANVFGKTQRINSTLAKQLAYYVVLYSPVQMAADFIENYEDQPAFQFIKEVPVDWETKKVIHAEIGEYITIARKDRNSGDWYLGSITNELKRNFTIPLDFLEEDKQYSLVIYEDGKHANWKNNPKELIIKELIGSKKDTLFLNLAPGGGAAVSIKENKPIK